MWTDKYSLFETMPNKYHCQIAGTIEIEYLGQHCKLGQLVVTVEANTCLTLLYWMQIVDWKQISGVRFIQTGMKSAS